jgi:hypothetical protein
LEYESIAGQGHIFGEATTLKLAGELKPCRQPSSALQGWRGLLCSKAVELFNSKFLLEARVVTYTMPRFERLSKA